MAENLSTLIRNGNLVDVVKILTSTSLFDLQDVAARLAVMNGQLAILQYTLDLGVNIHQDNETLLHSAIVHNHLNIVIYLLQRGANIHARNEHFFFIACENGFLDILIFLLNHDNKFNKRMFFLFFKTAIISGHLKIVEYLLISQDIDVSFWNETSLRLAVSNNHYEIVKLIIDYGADIHNDDEYPLVISCQEGYYDIAKFLIENGADIHVESDWPLRIASENGHLDIVQLLVENGADVTAHDNYAVEWASQNGHLEVVEYLLNHGAVLDLEEEEEVGEQFPIIAPDDLASEEIIDITKPENFKYKNICNSGNEFEEDDMGNKLPLDPVIFTPIPEELLVSVKRINNDKNITCYNAESLWRHWIEQTKLTSGITFKYANDPITRGYFNEASVIYVHQLLQKLNLI